MMLEQIARRVKIRRRTHLAPRSFFATRARAEIAVLQASQIVELFTLPDFLDCILAHIPQHILVHRITGIVITLRIQIEARLANVANFRVA